MACPTASRTAKAKDQDAPPQLSCKLCREKKMKCDKQAPCGNCKSIGAECYTVFRHRLPRGRHARSSGGTSTSQSTSPSQDSPSDQGTHNQERNKRVRRSEKLVAEQAPDVLSELDQDTPMEPRSDDTGSFLYSSDVLSDNHVDLDWSDTARNAPKLVQNGRFGPSFEEFPQQSGLLGLDDNIEGSSGLRLWNSETTPHIVGESSVIRSTAREIRLCDIYFRQVDPVIKILHRPTVERWLRRGHPYLHYPQGHTSTEALVWAIYYSAVCSMTEEQCQTVIQQKRSAAVASYQRACQNALDHAGYLTTDDVVVIQAFVLYLIGRKVHDKSLATWTLTAVLVRIATAQDIHVETREKESNFDQQMRTRLWLTICSMDLQASVAQSSRPLITVDDVRPALSRIKNINDEDLTKEVADNNTIQDREEFADVTLALIWYHLQVTGRLLYDPVDASQGRTQQDSVALRVNDHVWREQQAREFQRKALELLSFCDTESSSYAWFTWHSTQCLISSVRISAARPIASVFSSNSTFLSRPNSNSDLFERIMRLLKKTLKLQSDLRVEGFRWHVEVPWIEIAIATSECFACHDPRIVCSVWPTIEAAFQLYESRATHSKTYRILARRMQQMQQMWARAASMPSLSQAACPYEDLSSLHTMGQLVPPPTPLLTPSTVPMENFSSSNWTAETSSSTTWSSLYSLPDDTTLQSMPSLTSELGLLSGAPILLGGKDSVANNGSQQLVPSMNLWSSPGVNPSCFDEIDIVLQAHDNLWPEARHELKGSSTENHKGEWHWWKEARVT